MSIFSTLASYEHTFTAWCAKEWQKFWKAEPSLVALADRVFPYAKSALQIGLSFEAPAVAAAAGPVLDKIHSGLDVAAGLLYDFGAHPTVSGVISTVQSDMSSLESVAGIKSTQAKDSIAKAMNSVAALQSAVTGAIAASSSTATTA